VRDLQLKLMTAVARLGCLMVIMMMMVVVVATAAIQLAR
jgi:hypothetical protein